MGTVQLENLLLLRMAGLLHHRPRDRGLAAIGIMMIQNMPDIRLHLIEVEGKEQGSGLEVPNLQNEQHTVRQAVVAVRQSSLFGGKTEEVSTLLVVELWPPIELFDLLIFQNLEPVFIPVVHGRLTSRA